MKTTVSVYDFREAFRRADRMEKFSYEGQGVLFEYLEEYEQDTGKELELDVIALCCEYNEDNPEDIASNYEIELPDDTNEDDIREVVRKYLKGNTIIVGETKTGFVYYTF